MRNTKEVILSTALDLFNSRGLSQVTLRTIAGETGISQGNLNYHFKKREDIIEALYFQLVQNIDEKIAGVTNSPISLNWVIGLSSLIMDNFFQFKFFLLDFVQIMRASTTIHTHYLALSEEREKQFTFIFQCLVREGFLREEEIVNEYANYYKRLRIMGDFWISSAEILNKNVTISIKSDYLKLIVESLYPYLTEKGKVEYRCICIDI
ncbi:MAG: TetR/AcrR family transcriptional regulator [Cyclobacteriaceae bacterium]|nr:TetR/AcrR family transcriptional regulator [Cyclobacteriaceae bacterium]